MKKTVQTNRDETNIGRGKEVVEFYMPFGQRDSYCFFLRFKGKLRNPQKVAENGVKTIWRLIIFEIF